MQENVCLFLNFFNKNLYAMTTHVRSYMCNVVHLQLQEPQLLWLLAHVTWESVLEWRPLWHALPPDCLPTLE